MRIEQGTSAQGENTHPGAEESFSCFFVLNTRNFAGSGYLCANLLNAPPIGFNILSLIGFGYAPPVQPLTSQKIWP